LRNVFRGLPLLEWLRKRGGKLLRPNQANPLEDCQSAWFEKAHRGGERRLLLFPP